MSMHGADNQGGYATELRELHHRRVYYILLLGMLLMLGFSVLDFLLVPQFFQRFFWYRLVVCACGMILLLVNYYDKCRRWSLPIGLLGYVLAGGVILVMIDTMGGVQSPYYVGLIVIMTIYTTLTPLTLSQTLLSGFLLVAGYLLVAGSGMVAESAMPLFSNIFFMFCFVCIAATQSATETAARKLEYALRRQEQQAASELKQQAKQLEQEVSYQTGQIKESEGRYQILFNALADDVVLVNHAGMILQANAAFKEHFGVEKVTQKHSIFDLFPLEEQRKFKKRMQEVLRTGTALTGYQVDLQPKNGQLRTMEIQASLLRHGNEAVGVQLVLRDISVRLALEKELVRSLQTIRQTEEAAILALAKLSEYRDTTTGHHLERVREYCRVVATTLAVEDAYAADIDDSFIYDIFHASVLHDIGKVTIPDHLLRSREPLTEPERERVRAHTLAGGNVIKAMEAEGHGSGFLTMAKSIAYFHHERWDGKGYPHGLSGAEIPLAARIMAVVDTYEEMTRGCTAGTEETCHAEAVQTIADNSGRMFDPGVVQALVSCQQQMHGIRRRYGRKTVAPTSGGQNRYKKY